jgi:hypothetical protein
MTRRMRNNVSTTTDTGRGLVTRFHHKAANYAALGNNIYTIYKREMTLLKGKYILKIPTI